MRTRCSSRVKGLPTLATALEVAHRRVKATVGASLPAQTYRPAVEVGCHLAQCPGGRRVEKSKIRLASPLGVLLLDNYVAERMVVGPSASPRAPPRPPHRPKPAVGTGSVVVFFVPRVRRGSAASQGISSGGFSVVERKFFLIAGSMYSAVKVSAWVLWRNACGGAVAVFHDARFRGR
jgi:hypothetical protein